MTTASRVLQIASGEIGYNRFNDPLAGTKYGRWYAEKTKSPYFGSSGVPYCNMFTTWVLSQAGIPEPAPGFFAYVPFCINAYAAAGKRINIRDAQPGDLVCFDWDDDGEADHIGIVEANRGSYLQTIEGNTSSGSSGSQSNGGGVYRRTRDWSSVCAILRPAYSGNASSNASVAKAGFRLTPDGYWGPATTRAAQKFYGTPVDGVVSGQDASRIAENPGLGDGWEVGSGGSQLIAAIQKSRGVTADGILGPETIKAMQRYYGTPVDGRFDEESACIIAFQNALNGSLAKRGIK